MPLDLDAIQAAIYSRLATDPAGTAARAILTGGVYPASQIIRGPIGTMQLPSTPFALWRPGPISGTDGDMRRVTGAWWVYDQPAQEKRIAAALEAIEATYPRDAVAFGLILVGPISPPLYDTTLGLAGRNVTISFLRRT
jgi:hypothetical protein